MAERIDITELDFDEIKANLKTFLSKQNEFTDYDFEGSGMAVLLDLLAYNTHYQAVYANMLANEMFLDSADLRNSVVSHAKHIGYTARSARSPFATLTVTVNDATGSTLTMPKGTAFTTTIDGVSYNYVTNTARSITPANGVFTFSNVKVYEGTLVTNKYTVDTSNANQRFLIKNTNADTSTLKVTVQNSSSDSTTNAFTLTEDITSVDSTSKVYFLEAVEDQQYEVKFGDGILGQALSNGNIVTLEYVVTNGADSNGATTFTNASSIAGFTNITVVTASASGGGDVAESVDSIKFNAPKKYSSQNRAVTANDYKALVRSLYANVQSIQVWGGEDNNPPTYGRVFIAIKPTSGVTLTNSVKDSITTSLNDFNVGSVIPVIVDPVITYLVPQVYIKYDSKITTKTDTDIETLVTTTIANFSTNNLEQFGNMFRYSKFIRAIDDTDSSILSNITRIKMYQYFKPNTSGTNTYTINFENSLYHPHMGHTSILETTGFNTNDGSGREYFLDDDGSGNVRLIYYVGGTKTVQNSAQGTINYTTGTITINNLYVTAVSNVDGATSTQIRVTTQPASNDIVPVRQQLIQIDTANMTVDADLDTYESNAGVGYTTNASSYIASGTTSSTSTGTRTTVTTTGAGSGSTSSY